MTIERCKLIVPKIYPRKEAISALNTSLRKGSIIAYVYLKTHTKSYVLSKGQRLSPGHFILGAQFSFIITKGVI